MSIDIDVGIDPKSIYGVFLDNDKGHLDRMKATYKNLLMIKIPDSGHAPQVSFEGTGGFAKFVESELAAGNLYCAGLQLLGRDGDSYDKLSGIQAEHIQKLYEFLEILMTAHPHDPMHVLLDWDRTLTVVEGYLGVEGICKELPPIVEKYKAEGILPADTDLGVITEEKKAKMFEYQLRYLFGGAGRLAMIRDMLDSLSEHDIHVWILTNNTGCTSDDFHRMVKHLGQGKGRIQRTICASFKTDTVGRRGNKTFAFTSELLEARKVGATAPAHAHAPSNSAASSSGGFRKVKGLRKTRRRHGPGRSRTRGRYHLRKSKKKKAATAIRR